MPEVQKVSGIISISEQVSRRVSEIKNISQLKSILEESQGETVSDLVETILGGAAILESSDVHLEPEEKKAKLRLRLDGILWDVISFDLKTYQSLLSRLKLLAGLKLNVRNRSQDGRFSITFGEEDIEIRASSLPADYGETVVLRLLNPRDLIDLEAMGLRPDLLETFSKEIEKPNGMIIVTGPTGSGKTTTLYGFLKKINKPELKIITIEDPIEYRLPGISQTQVEPQKESGISVSGQGFIARQPGYTFANGLRAIVRQDPDVILVGEIRDLETAQIAIQAALTGHLVFATLHTNDAAGTIARLQALGEKPVNIAPAVNMIIAQRLVRRICAHCGQKTAASKADLEKLQSELKTLAGHIQYPPLDKNLKILKEKGCNQCNQSGYKGRVAIFEAFLIDDEMEKLILQSPSIVELKEKAIKKGMVTMRQDGFLKVLDGVTTLEEIERMAGVGE